MGLVLDCTATQPLYFAVSSGGQPRNGGNRVGGQPVGFFGGVINRILRTQLLVALGLAAVAVVFGLDTGLSALAGGLVSVVSNIYFARKVFVGDSGSPEAEAARIYVAEFIKIALAAVLLTAVWTMVEGVVAIALIVGFLFVHFSAALATLGTSELRDKQI